MLPQLCASTAPRACLVQEPLCFCSFVLPQHPAGASTASRAGGNCEPCGVYRELCGSWRGPCVYHCVWHYNWRTQAAFARGTGAAPHTVGDCARPVAQCRACPALTWGCDLRVLG